MDADLKHPITNVCDINETKFAYTAVLYEGITDINDFLGFGFERHHFTIHRNHQTKLSQVVAYAIHLETTNDANAKSFTAYIKANFDEWRRLHYLPWVTKQKATALAAASNLYAGNTKEKFNLESFVKMTQNVADYTVLKDEEIGYTFKIDLERLSKNHLFHRLLTSTHETKKDFEATLVADSLDAELFERQCNFLSLIFKNVLHTVKGRDIRRENKDDSIAV